MYMMCSLLEDQKLDVVAALREVKYREGKVDVLTNNYGKYSKHNDKQMFKAEWWKSKW